MGLVLQLSACSEMPSAEVRQASVARANSAQSANQFTREDSRVSRGSKYCVEGLSALWAGFEKAENRSFVGSLVIAVQQQRYNLPLHDRPGPPRTTESKAGSATEVRVCLRD